MANLNAIGSAIVKEIQKEVIRMGLINLGTYLSSIKYKIKGNKIVVYSALDYAECLEYGTYDFGRWTRSNFPETAATAKGLKKKDLPYEIRKALPKGMVAFAPFRRVLYNQELIRNIILANQ